MLDLGNWRPAHTIKAYPELQGHFSRGENHLLAYLHNWSAQLSRKGKDGEWVFLTQRQIAEAIDYSVASVKRFIQQINKKLQGIIQTRSRQVWLTKDFYYRIFEYRIDWGKTLQLVDFSVSTDLLETAVMAQSSHYHFELGVVQDELGVAQDELIYKDPFKDQVNKKNTSPTPPKKSEKQSGEFELDDLNKLPNTQTAFIGLPEFLVADFDIGEDRSFAAAKKMNSLSNRGAAAMGLIRRTHDDGSYSWTESPAGRAGGRSAWIDQGIALELWPSKELAIEFQGQVAQYARNQDWCKSPLDYTNSVIKGLLNGDNPKADRYWEAWHNGQLIGWENLFNWEVQPGVINPAFANWVTTQLFDSTKSAAANTTEAAKQLRFSARQLWARFQREVAREVENADQHQERGQAYLPPGAMLPRSDQPTAESTGEGLDRLMRASGLIALPEAQLIAVAVLSATAPVALLPEMTVGEFAVANPDRADIFAKMERIGGAGCRFVGNAAKPQAEVIEAEAIEPEVFNCVEDSSEQVARPLKIQLLPVVLDRRRQLEAQYRRKKPPYDLVQAAKYLVWAERGDEVMQAEAIDWLESHDSIFG